MTDNPVDKHDMPADLTWFDVAVWALAVVGAGTLAAAMIYGIARLFLQ